MEIAQDKQAKTLGETLWFKRKIQELRETNPVLASELWLNFALEKRKQVRIVSTIRQRAKKFKLNYCEQCYSTENLDMHHINGNPIDNRKENIKTLCAWHHRRLHNGW